MANWVAGHTDRFRGIVTHASLWELRGFHGTTDHGPSWEVEFGDPYVDPSRYEAASPHRFVDRIRTPMLVIHGELDHRVPISEALRLWTDLRRHDVPSRFLYFPDENHWVLKPQNARLWYGTVLAFLDEHGARPALGAPGPRLTGPVRRGHGVARPGGTRTTLGTAARHPIRAPRPAQGAARPDVAPPRRPARDLARVRRLQRDARAPRGPDQRPGHVLGALRRRRRRRSSPAST